MFFLAVLLYIVSIDTYCMELNTFNPDIFLDTEYIATNFPALEKNNKNPLLEISPEPQQIFNDLIPSFEVDNVGITEHSDLENNYCDPRKLMKKKSKTDSSPYTKSSPKKDPINQIIKQKPAINDTQYPCNDCSHISFTRVDKHNHGLQFHKKPNHPIFDQEATIRFFSCNFCYKSIRYDLINKHKIEQHVSYLNNKYQCAYCGETSSKKVQMNIHLLRKHNNFLYQCMACFILFDNPYYKKIHENNCIKSK